MFPKVSLDAIAGVAQDPERSCLHFTYKKVLLIYKNRQTSRAPPLDFQLECFCVSSGPGML